MGEAKRRRLARENGSVGIDTYAGKIHGEWNPHAAVTPFRSVTDFHGILKVSGLFDAVVEGCPLEYKSLNAPDKRDVLGPLMLSILAGRKRYAHITVIRSDGVNPVCWG